MSAAWRSERLRQESRWLDRNAGRGAVAHIGVLTADSVLELPAGTIASSGTQAGDQLEIKTLG